MRTISRREFLFIGTAIVLVLLTVPPALAAGVAATRQELGAERAWFKQHLLDCRPKAPQTGQAQLPPQPAAPGLEVLANNDPVTRNGRGGHRMKIGDKEYSRGLYCHAVSRVDVRLPGPGKTFTAVVGLDHNDDTARGKGSVVFTVRVGGKVAFQSDVMRFGTPGRDVNVDLGGAEMFTLEIGDAGDGIGWDQSDWADAKVTLVNGRELWLGDMPLRDLRPELGPALLPRTSDLPISFVYGGKASDELLANWPRRIGKRKLDGTRAEHTFTWTDPRTGLEVRCVAVEYRDFPVVEWTVHFRNAGREDTPILENVQALDVRLDRGPASEFVLHGNKGDWCAPQSYEPYQLTLGPGTSNRFAPDGGRPTNGPRGWPYFNLQQTGDWIAWQFDRPDLRGGVVQAFRRDKNEVPVKRLRLSGLQPAAKYVITNLDVPATTQMTGRALMEEGLSVEIKTTPGAAVICYRKQ